MKDPIVYKLISCVNIFLDKSPVDDGHNFNHAWSVYLHCTQALSSHPIELSPTQKRACLMACLLHDVDDHKFFNTKNYENAKELMGECQVDTPTQNLTIQMIKLVGCTENKNNEVDDEYLLIPRWCDRLESLGYRGILRCYKYSLYKKRPLYVSSTKRANNREELYIISPPSRFENYNGTSKSMMDHIYDKFLHITLPNNINPYIRSMSERLHEETIKFCLDFGQRGVVDINLIRKKGLSKSDSDNSVVKKSHRRSTSQKFKRVVEKARRQSIV